LVQSFSAHMPLLTATRTFGLGRRHWRSPQQCYPHRLCTCIAGNWWITVRANHAYRDKLTYKQCKCFWWCYHNHSHCKSSPGSVRLGAGWPLAFRPRQPTCPVGCCCPHLLGQKSKLLILSECVNKTEKTGWTWTNTNSYRENEALCDIFTWNILRHNCFMFKHSMTESSQ